MTEQEWQKCGDPMPMLALLLDKASERKLRLFAAACYRRILSLFKDKRTKKAVDFVERLADGLATTRQLHDSSWGRTTDGSQIVLWNAWDAAYNSTAFAAERMAQTVAEQDQEKAARWELAFEEAWLEASYGLSESWSIADEALSDAPAWLAQRDAARAAEEEQQTKLLRCVFGNPFRPVHIDPAWLTPDITALAQAIYDERRFADLPILADALEEAGCTSDDMLSHCRDGDEHVRGCWVVDLLLGKS